MSSAPGKGSVFPLDFSAPGYGMAAGARQHRVMLEALVGGPRAMTPTCDIKVSHAEDRPYPTEMAVTFITWKWEYKLREVSI